jgi:integrase
VKAITDRITKKKIYFYGKTEREINQKILQYKEEQQVNRQKFSNIADEWWKSLGYSNLQYQTIKSYKPSYERAKEEFGTFAIQEIRPKNINKFLLKLKQKDYSFKTIANNKLVLNLIFNYAVLENYIEYNPCASVSIPKDLVRNIRKPAEKNDEALIKNNADIWIFPLIALYTGMRKGEILALQWKDINFEENTITVTKSVYFEGNTPRIKEPKTKAGYRTIPLLPRLKDELLKSKKDDNEYVISENGKDPITHKKYVCDWKRFQRITGIKCTAHQLRHSFATIAFESNIPVKAVQEVLGHKQLSTTMDIYTAFRKESLDMFKKMNL